MSLASSIADEWQAMFSGHFVPYHKLGCLVAFIVTALFAVFFSHEVVFEAPIAVVDLDGSRYSTQLIEKLNTSPFLKVVEVRRTPTSVVSLTRRDHAQAVVVLPQALQEAVHRGERSVRIGLFADDTNTAQNAELYNSINEIVSTLGGEIAAGRLDGVSSLGKNSDETAAAMAAFSLSTRYLSNPTGQSTTATIVFLFFFSTMFQAMACLMIPGRLRVTGQWNNKVLANSPWELIARVMPYALVATAAVTAAMAVLINFGQLRFAGNIFLFVTALFMVEMANGTLSIVMAWSARQPSEGASRMIWLVPPGFVLGGATMAQGFAHDWVQQAALGIPLTWIFRFWREHGLRGCGFDDSLFLFGELLLYLTFIAALLFVRFAADAHKYRRACREQWKIMREITSPDRHLC